MGNCSDDYCINSMISTTSNGIVGFLHQLIVGLDLMDGEESIELVKGYCESEIVLMGESIV